MEETMWMDMVRSLNKRFFDNSLNITGVEISELSADKPQAWAFYRGNGNSGIIIINRDFLGNMSEGIIFHEMLHQLITEHSPLFHELEQCYYRGDVQRVREYTRQVKRERYNREMEAARRKESEEVKNREAKRKKEMEIDSNMIYQSAVVFLLGIAGIYWFRAFPELFINRCIGAAGLLASIIGGLGMIGGVKGLFESIRD